MTSYRMAPKVDGAGQWFCVTNLQSFLTSFVAQLKYIIIVFPKFKKQKVNKTTIWWTLSTTCKGSWGEWWLINDDADVISSLNVVAVDFNWVDEKLNYNARLKTSDVATLLNELRCKHVVRSEYCKSQRSLKGHTNNTWHSREGGGRQSVKWTFFAC